MKTNLKLARTLQLLALAFAGVLSAHFAAAQSAPPPAVNATKLATEPFISTNKLRALPNLMFVLDDSLSMSWNFLPDRAGPYEGFNADGDWVVKTPAHRFFNIIFNGVAYDPSVRYVPPVMYDASGNRDTTIYPAMSGTSAGSGTSATTGGDAAATAAAPNWKAVPVDGYGVQSTEKRDLEAKAFYYTTVPGEYCDSEKLRNCVPRNANDPVNVGGVDYKYPAKLRWCTTAAQASTRASASVNGQCQAGNIADTPASQASGVTPYTFARMPNPRTVTITFNAGTVTNLTVQGSRIIHGSVSGTTSSELATKLAANINDCTYSKAAGPTPAESCASVGYKAEAQADKLIIEYPGSAEKPVVTGTAAGSGSLATVGSVASSVMPGESIFTVISRDNDRYKYPGTNARHPDRSDCASTDYCTYAEEMANYANWYAYYRTRMQMMKTAASVAFTKLDENFRVGYYSLNNGANKQFLNVKPFENQQRYDWYQKFLTAVPKGETPLRTALANVGRFYAGKFNGQKLNDVDVSEPMQYSCQPNFTILSTDGYWNEGTYGSDGTQTDGFPLQIDGVTAIGQQDGHLPRPFYDGGTQRRQTTQLQQTVEQRGLSSWQHQAMVRQLQKKTDLITKTVTTTEQWPYEKTQWQLQRAESRLKQDVYPLEKKVSPVSAVLWKLTQSTRQLSSTPYDVYTTENLLQKWVTPLSSQQYNSTKTTWYLSSGSRPVEWLIEPVQEWKYRITQTVKPLVETTYLLTATEKPLQKVDWPLRSETRPLQTRSYRVKQTETPVYQQKYFITESKAPLTETSYLFTKVTTPLLKRTKKIIRVETGLRKTETQPYQTVWKLQKNVWAYKDGTFDWSGLQDVPAGGSCDTRNLTNGVNDRCIYKLVSEGLVASCSPMDKSSGPSYSVVNATTCEYKPENEVTTDVTQCTINTGNATRVSCAYTGTVKTVNDATSCSNVESTSTINGAVWNGPKVACSASTEDKTVESVSSCTNVSASFPNIVCEHGEYGTTFTKATAYDQTTCTPYTPTPPLTGTVSGPKIECSYVKKSENSNAASCTLVNANLNKTVPNDTKKAYTTCVYGTLAESNPKATSCTPQGTSPVSGKYYPQVTCVHGAKDEGTDGRTKVTSSTCTNSIPNPATTQKILCENGLATEATTTLVDTCTVKTKGSSTAHGVVFNAPSVSCARQTGNAADANSLDYVAPPAAVAAGASCTVNAGGATTQTNDAEWTTKVQCGYSTAEVTDYNGTVTREPSLTSCEIKTGKDSTGTTYSGSQTQCFYEAKWKTTGGTPVGSCTVIKPTIVNTSNATVSQGSACMNSAATAPQSNLTTCTTVAEVPILPAEMTDGKIFSDAARVCTYQTQPSSTVTYTPTNPGTCQAHAQDTVDKKEAEVRCTYNAVDSNFTLTNQDACPYQSEGPDTNKVYRVAVACTYEEPVKTFPSNNTCQSKAKPSNNTATYTECQYPNTPQPEWQTANAPCIPQGKTADANGIYYTAVSCRPKEGGVVAWTPADSCTQDDGSRTDANGKTYWVSSTVCDYTRISPPRDTNSSLCTESGSRTPTQNAQGQNVYVSPVVECVRNTVSVGEPTQYGEDSSCLPVSGLSADGKTFTTQTVCTYGTEAKEGGLTTVCTVKQPTSSNPFPGATVRCTSHDQPAQKTNDCTQGAPVADNVALKKSWKTCAYGEAGVASPDLTTCTHDPRKTIGVGTKITPATECAPTGFKRETVNSWEESSTLKSCEASGSEAVLTAPWVTCDYQTGEGTPTTERPCVPHEKTADGVAKKEGPVVACEHVYNASVSTLSATACTPSTGKSADGKSFTGDKIECGYRATANASTPTTKDMTSCTSNYEAGPSYTQGAKKVCSYQAQGNFTDTAVACTTTPQSEIVENSNATTYGMGVNCQYRVDTVTGAEPAGCQNLPAQSVEPNWTVIRPAKCDEKIVKKVTTSTPASVEQCSTKPSRTGDLAGNPPSKQTDVTTACVPQQTATPANVTDCAPAGGKQSVSENGVNFDKYEALVTCSATNPEKSYSPVPACVNVGLKDGGIGVDGTPSGFDGGRIVHCQTKEPIDSGSGTRAAAKPYWCDPLGESVDKNFVYRSCLQMSITGPDGVAPGSCVAAEASSDNAYTRTTCETVVKNPGNTPSMAEVTGCLSEEPSAENLWTKIECTHNEGGGTKNTLADVAAYYYYTDLRQPAFGNCQGALLSTTETGAQTETRSDLCLKNDVPTTLTDTNPAQHMTTFTLGLGVSGYMKYSDSYLADALLSPPQGDYATVWGTGSHRADEGINASPSTGVCSWQPGGQCNWPFPRKFEQTTVDDLWHAGVNGHGAYFSATNPQSLANSISGALVAVKAAGGAAAAPTISTPALTPTESYAFRSTYVTSDWSGELRRYQIHPYTGKVIEKADWAVSGKLDAKPFAERRIYTWKADALNGNLQAFNATNFGASDYFKQDYIKNNLVQFACPINKPEICLSEANQTAAAGDKLVDFLRGDRENEGGLEDTSKYFRKRASRMGDMVNAQVVYVQKPTRRYADPGHAAYVENKLNRQAMVYAGANDGMLHAFAAKGSDTTEAKVEAAANASAAYYLNPSNDTRADMEAKVQAAETALAGDTTVAQEQWAYIPSALLPNLHRLADKEYYGKHRYFIDATPESADICVQNCTTDTAVWKTILVGGLGRGGRAYYALDITDPASPKALWEFADTNLGYSFGKPRIVKKKDGTWVVLLSSGYNNIPNSDGSGGDGVGRVYVLNAYTGVKLAELKTTAGSPTEPSGLAQIAAEVVNATRDATVTAVYGGDLLGNLWRFDVNADIGWAEGDDPISAAEQVQLLATLRDADGSVQPITTQPEIVHIREAEATAVLVGTGRMLHTDDTANIQKQSFYAIKDVKAKVTSPGTAIFANPRSIAGFANQEQVAAACTEEMARNDWCCTQAFAAHGMCVYRSVDQETVLVAKGGVTKADWVHGNGWMFDFNYTGERMSTNPAVANGMLVFNTNAPTTEACDMGGKSYQRQVDFRTGTAASDLGYVGSFLDSSLASSVALVVTKSGRLVSISGTSGSGGSGSGGSTSNTGAAGMKTRLVIETAAGAARRVSWRELVQEE